MNYLSVENLSKHYGERKLFSNLNFGLNKGDKMALVASNGAGKTTLLKILVDKDTSDSGKVAFRQGIRVGFLEQEPVFDDTKTINEYVATANSRLLSVIREYEQTLETQANDYNEKTQKAFELASAKMDELNAWDHERQIKTILTKFKIQDLEQKVATLSGGQRKRLALALVLLDNPELLILDEPTNHLDVEMIEWLEDYLSEDAITVLMVTHDRYFLDRVCNHILEMEDGKLFHHHGNYSFFIQKRAEREEVYSIEIDKAQKLMKKELEWMRKMPKARTTKSKSRIDAFYETKEIATSRKPTQELKLEVKMSRIGGKVLELKKVYKNYGDLKILSGYDYTFKKGERIGIVGKNGVGKTTFLNLITGIETPDNGKVNTGDTIIYGYYTQKGMKLKEDKRVIEVVKDIADVITLGDGTSLSASQFLQHFMFSPAMQYTYVSKLSGGEKRRLYLLTVLIKNPNFLILDEPTNDLDILTLNKLEDFLLGFGGCLLLVSHDRYFMDKMVDQLFIFEGDGMVRSFLGTYTEYRNEEQEKAAAEKKLQITNYKLQITNQKPATPLQQQKISGKEKREYEKLEKEIAELEKEKSEIETAIHTRGISYEEISEKSIRIGKVIELIDEKTYRWLELGEKIESEKLFS